MSPSVVESLAQNLLIWSSTTPLCGYLRLHVNGCISKCAITKMLVMRTYVTIHVQERVVQLEQQCFKPATMQGTSPAWRESRLVRFFEEGSTTAHCRDGSLQAYREPEVQCQYIVLCLLVGRKKYPSETPSSSLASWST